MAWTEKPPILTGRNSQDLANLRDYLFRMAQSLTEVEKAGAMSVSYRKDGTQVLTPAKDNSDVELVKRNAEELRGLIIKTADQVIAEMDSRDEYFRGHYISESQFGTFDEKLDRRIQTNAAGEIEKYDYNAIVQGIVGNDIDSLQSYVTELNGYIRRGVIEDPDTHEKVIGIVIAQDVKFTGSTYTQDGQTYYYVKPDSTFGIYTATGWQFWINGIKVGWFSSEDSMLHVSNIVVEQSLRGGVWEMTFTNGFGIKYTGA